MWEAKTAVSESVWTEGYLKEILGSHARRPLPRPMFHIGSTDVVWEEVIPGRYFIETIGGTVDDRCLARAIVAGQLDAYGLQSLNFTLGGTDLKRTADWNEVQAKAIRLMNDGNVQILRNAPDVIVGHVIGDHGEYQTEISRQDPNSNVISHWTCQCPYDQFAWQRTRRWKSLEGRPCSHVLATQWYAQGMPLDQEYDPVSGQPIAPETPHGQLRMPLDTGQPVPLGGGMAPPGMPGSSPPAPQSQQLSIPGIDPSGPIANPPMPPGPSILPPMPMGPMPVPVSIPGAKVPDATNPMQWPGGTFSKVTDIEDPEDESALIPWESGEWGKGLVGPDGRHITWTNPGYHHPEVSKTIWPGSYSNQNWPHTISPEGEVVGFAGVEYPDVIFEDDRLYPEGQKPSNWIFSKVATDWEFDDGKLDGYKWVWDDNQQKGILHDVAKDGMAYHHEIGSHLNEPTAGGSVTPEGIIDIAWDLEGDMEILPSWEISHPMIEWLKGYGFRMPANAQEASYADGHGYKIAAAGDTFQNSDMVRINKEEYGIAEGKSEEHGAGEWRTIKKNSIGEVLGQDPTTGWVDTIWPIHDSGPMEPYHIRAWVEPANLTLMPGIAKPGPFIRRKRNSWYPTAMQFTSKIGATR